MKQDVRQPPRHQGERSQRSAAADSGNDVTPFVGERHNDPGGYQQDNKTEHAPAHRSDLLGSVTRAWMRTCTCRVWAIKLGGSGLRYRTILAAIDPLADDPG